MSSRTCAYVASKDDPESWHGTDSSTFFLDRPWRRGGLGIEEWHCPHPPLDRADGSDSDQHCIFHTDPAELPKDVNESEALLDALEDAGDGPRTDRPEHRGQFIGATFGAVDLSGETIAATDDYDIRFDHAQFRAGDASLDFSGTTLLTEGHHVSFAGTEFTTDGKGNVWFNEATFRTKGKGHVRFDEATFRTAGEGSVWFGDATFRTDGRGHVRFGEATFRTDGEGIMEFGKVTFRTDGEGDVWFRDATFRTDGGSSVQFGEATFRTAGEGSVWFGDATFRNAGESHVAFPLATFQTDGEGDVWFGDATFRADGKGYVRFEAVTFRTAGEGDVRFDKATFRTTGEGHVTFEDAILHNAEFRKAEFGEADFRGVDLTGTDLREANIADISVNGATTCERVNEGYEENRSTERITVPAPLRRLYEGSHFDDEAWDATARSYHQLKTVFGEHGLVSRARAMHVRERRARSLEVKAVNGQFAPRYLRSLPSRVFTGYGVQVWKLASWMVVLFFVSTLVYVNAGVENTLANNVAYSVLAFTVAPPRIPSGLGTQIVMMFETFFGTLSIVLLGYILGNRERF